MAVGFKMSSLLKLAETRSNTARMTLLHYLVEEAGKENKEVFDFADELQAPLLTSDRYGL